MTDKQIIDGVDVSGCPDHYNGWSRLHRDTRPMCGCSYDRECKPREYECNHYVKCLEQKLLRKEQECEKVKNWIKSKMFYTDCENWFERFVFAFNDWQNDLTKQLDKLKAENEILKEKLVISSNADKQTIKMIQALDDIEVNVGEIKENFRNLTRLIPSFQVDSIFEDIVTIQDIINEAKDGE